MPKGLYLLCSFLFFLPFIWATTPCLIYSGNMFISWLMHPAGGLSTPTRREEFRKRMELGYPAEPPARYRMDLGVWD